MSRRNLALLALVGAALVALVACAPAPAATPTAAPGAAPAGEPKYGGTLRTVHKGGTGPAADPDGWDPHKIAALATHYNTNMVYSKLFQFPQGPQADPNDYSTVGDLAESWEYTNPTTLVVRLRQGVRFQNKPPVNGRELTSEDVKFTYERLKKVATFAASLYEAVASIEALDRYTVRFNLKGPDSGLLNAMSQHFGVILAKEAGGPEQDWTRGETAIGTGPFMLKEWVPAVKVVYEPNPTYFKKDAQGRRLPYLGEVYWPRVDDPSTRLAAFLAGQIDLVTADATEAPLVRRTRPDAIMEKSTTPINSGIDIRTDQPPFNDVRVRQAMSMSFDRDDYIKVVHGGEGNFGGVMPWVFVKPGLVPALEEYGAAAKYFKYDPAEAKRLLAEAGYPNGFDTQLNTTQRLGGDIAEYIAPKLTAVGVRAKIVLKDYAADRATTYRGVYDGLAVNTGGQSFHPNGYLIGWFHSKGGFNRAHYSDPKMDEMLDRLQSALDAQEYKRLSRDISIYAAEKAIRILVPVAWSYQPYYPYVKNYRYKVDFDPGRNQEIIWVDRG